MSGSALQRTEFDSEIFGVDFYRVVHADPGLVEAGLQAIGSGPAIVDVKLPADNQERIAGFDALGFRKASTMVEFRGPVQDDALRDAACTGALTLGADDLSAHAEAFRFQRFMQDGRIPRARTMEFMRRWIANSLAGRRETAAIGRNFCTYSIADERLTIDLLSSLDSGQGMARRLMASIHAIAASRGCMELQVTTEAENVPAMRVYFRAGCLPVASTVAMHLVRGTGQG